MSRSHRNNPGSQKSKGSPAPVLITPGMLRKWKLPRHDEGTDKNARGRVLILGGELEVAGSVVLAATSAFRAGAGKITIATVHSVMGWVEMAVPESRVVGLPETKKGGIAAAGVDILADLIPNYDVFLVGPGMLDQSGAERLLLRLAPYLEETPTILDAAAIVPLRKKPDLLHRLKGRAMITPNRDEMAIIRGTDSAGIENDPVGIAAESASDYKATVVLKGSSTYIVSQGEPVYLNQEGNSGLAISGSGDTLAGIIAGLISRGATFQQGAAWGVYLHARAGVRLARRLGPIGYLPRELSAEVPGLMVEIGRERKQSRSTR